MKIFQTTVLFPIVALMFILAGCEKEGPAEKAGKNLDDAMEQIQEKAGDAGDKAMETLEERTDKVEAAADSAAQ